MAKNDNLTDFLKGLADKFRSVLGTADPLNPQEFEDKIQGVYDKGFSQGGPTGITAAAADVLAGKVFGSGGSAVATGTMANRAGATLTTTTRSLSGGYLVLQPPSAGYMTTATKLRCAQANVASTIGLTAATLVAGNTVLGIAGTAPAANILAVAVTNITANYPAQYTYYLPNNEYLEVSTGNLGVTGDGYNSAPNGSLRVKKAFTAKVVVAGKFTGDFFHRLWISNGSSGGSTFDCQVNGSTKTVLSSYSFSAGQYIFIQAGNGVNAGAVVFLKA